MPGQPPAQERPPPRRLRAPAVRRRAAAPTGPCPPTRRLSDRETPTPTRPGSVPRAPTRGTRYPRPLAFPLVRDRLLGTVAGERSHIHLGGEERVLAPAFCHRTQPSEEEPERDRDDPGVVQRVDGEVHALAS